MDKQDKTAEATLFNKMMEPIEPDNKMPLIRYDVVISAMESYAQHRTAELQAKIKEQEELTEFWINKAFEFEAKIKALESELHSEIHDNGILHKKMEALKERLEAADEVVDCLPLGLGFMINNSDVVTKIAEALGKYQSLNQ